MASERTEEIALPKWIIPDTSARDKGKLLFIEGWGEERRYYDSWWFTSLLIFIIILGGSLVVMFIVTLDDLTPELAIVIFLIFFGPAIFGFFIILISLQRYPMCIYENGFTLPRINPRSDPPRPKQPGEKLLDRREVFVRWRRVTSVNMEDRGAEDQYRGQHIGIIIHYDPHRSTFIPDRDLEDLSRIMEYMNAYVPDRIDPSVHSHVEKKIERAMK